MAFVITLVAHEGQLNDHIVKMIQKELDTNALPSQHTNLQWLSPGTALDLFIAQKPDKSQLRKWRKMLWEHGCDIFIHTQDSRRKKLLIADMDSTILSGETLDELAEQTGLGDEIALITEKAMRGELDFHQAVRERVAMLQGLKEADILKTIHSLTFNAGATSLVKTLKKHGCITILISGGFMQFASWAADKLGFDHVHCNHLIIEQGALTGKVKEPILDASVKKNLLTHYTRLYHLGDEETMAVGDGANDIPMLKKASLGVGYRAKPKVAYAVENVISFSSLKSLLYIQGYSDDDIIGDECALPLKTNTPTNNSAYS